jgi:hypothetical protein
MGDVMDFPGLLAAMVKHLTRKAMYFGCYRYRVLEQVGSLVSLQAVGSVEGLPDMLMLPKAHGFASVTEDLMPSAMVLVQFEGGDPGAPFIAHYLSGPPLPNKILIDAQTEIKLGAAAEQFVALAATTDANFTAIKALLVPIATLLNGIASGLPVVTLGPGTIPPFVPASVSAVKVKAQ